MKILSSKNPKRKRKIRIKVNFKLNPNDQVLEYKINLLF